MNTPTQDSEYWRYEFAKYALHAVLCNPSVTQFNVNKITQHDLACWSRIQADELLKQLGHKIPDARGTR